MDVERWRTSLDVYDSKIFDAYDKSPPIHVGDKFFISSINPIASQNFKTGTLEVNRVLLKSLIVLRIRWRVDSFMLVLRKFLYRVIKTK
jgi:hypothetical protein